MKQTIKLESIELSQEKVIKKGLKLTHLFLIDYLYQFFSSGCAKYVIKGRSDIYYYITANKILADMPIFNIKKRRLQELISDLEKIKVISRYKGKSTKSTYLKLNLSPLLP